MIKIKQCRHGRLLFYDNDTYIGKSLDVSGVYSEEEILLWQQIVKPGHTVIEVGANIGAHTVWFSKAVGPSGRVIAVEPQRQLFHMLCGNLALNEVKNTSATFAALGAACGTVPVPHIEYGKPGNFGGVSLGGDGEAVPVLPLDTLNINPDFMKIDVEGMEADVLRGARETIERCRPVLYVENDRKEKSEELVELIRDLGYVLYWHHPLINRELFGNMVSLNMLCVQPGVSVIGLKEVETVSSDERTRRNAMVAALEHGAVI
jgi:FkbM family methyltransferase